MDYDNEDENEFFEILSGDEISDGFFDFDTDINFW